MNITVTKTESFMWNAEVSTYTEWLTNFNAALIAYEQKSGWKSGKHKEVAKTLRSYLNKYQEAKEQKKDLTLWGFHTAMKIKEELERQELHPRGRSLGRKKSFLFTLRKYALQVFNDNENVFESERSKSVYATTLTTMNEEDKKQYKKEFDLANYAVQVKDEKEKINEMLAQYQQEVLELRKYKQGYEKLVPEYEALKKNAKDLSDAHAQLDQSLKTTLGSNTQLTEQLGRLALEKQKLVQENNELVDKNIEVSKQLDKAQKKLEKKESEMKAEFQKNEKIIADFQNQLQAVSAKKDEIAQKLEAEKKRVTAEANVNRTDSKRQLQGENSKVTSLEKENAELKVENKKLREEKENSSQHQNENNEGRIVHLLKFFRDIFKSKESLKIGENKIYLTEGQVEILNKELFSSEKEQQPAEQKKQEKQPQQKQKQEPKKQEKPQPKQEKEQGQGFFAGFFKQKAYPEAKVTTDSKKVVDPKDSKKEEVTIESNKVVDSNQEIDPNRSSQVLA